MGLIITKYNLGPSFYFYNGTVELRFDRDKWLYVRVQPDGSLVPLEGVTSTCKIIDKSAAIAGWAVRTALAKTRKLLIEGGYAVTDAQCQTHPLFIETLDKLLEEARKEDKRALEDAGEVGHQAHDWIERYIKSVLKEDTGRQHELLAKLLEDPRAENCCIAAVVWMGNHNVRWISTERKVFSLEYGYAGTLDATALVDSCNDPACCSKSFEDQLSIVDWKSANYLFIEFLLQTASYQHADEEEKGLKYAARWIIRLEKKMPPSTVVRPWS